MNKTLSIIIPVLNEEKTIAEVIRRVAGQSLGSWDREIIVVDDGSSDRTSQILSELLTTNYALRLITHQSNQGKGTAIKSGLAVATGEAVIIQDADLEYSPAEFPALLLELENHAEAAAIFGSRNLKPKRHGYTTYVWGVAVLTWVINILYGARLTDSYTCYKLFRANVLKSLDLRSRGFEFEAEVTCKLLRRKRQIREIPIDYFPRSFAEGKHIRFKDAAIGLWTIIKNRI